MNFPWILTRAPRRHLEGRVFSTYEAALVAWVGSEGESATGGEDFRRKRTAQFYLNRELEDEAVTGFSEHWNANEKRDLARFIGECGNVKADHVVEVGAGTGRLSDLLVTLANKRYTIQEPNAALRCLAFSNLRQSNSAVEIVATSDPVTSMVDAHGMKAGAVGCVCVGVGMYLTDPEIRKLIGSCDWVLLREDVSPATIDGNRPANVLFCNDGSLHRCKDHFNALIEASGGVVANSRETHPEMLPPGASPIWTWLIKRR